MAQYFVPRRRHQSPPAAAREAPQQHERAWSARELAESSVYVFPNPSSAPPSPSQLSDLSVPTDCTLSSALLSESASRESSVLPASRNPERQSWFSPSPLSTPLSLLPDGADVDMDQWEWDTGIPAEDSLLVGVEDEADRLDRWEILSRRRARDQFLCSLSSLQTKLSSSGNLALLKGHLQTSSPSASAVIATPHARIHIPLLSFLVSLLSVDDGTLHLLTHSSGHSALFPGNALLPPGESEATATDGETAERHGMEKLLAGRPDETQMMKEGMAVASNPVYAPSSPFLTPFHFVGLWDFVSGLVTNGGKALREVLQTPPSPT